MGNNIKINNEIYGTSVASEISYNGGVSGLEATNTQDAIDKIMLRLPFSLAIDENGNYGYKKAGADTVIPFKTGNEYKNIIVDSLANTKKGLTYDSTWEDIARVINELFPAQLNLLSKWGVSEVYKMPTWWDEPITWYSEEFDITNYSTLQRSVTYGWTSGSGETYGTCRCYLITNQATVSLLGGGGIDVSRYTGLAKIQISVGGAKPWKPTSNSTTRAWCRISSLVLYA